MVSTRIELPVGPGVVGDAWRGDAGRGVVILLHGGGQTRHSWRRTGERLAAGGWTVASLDARGHGESGWSSDGDYSLDVLVGDLRRVVERSPEPPVLVGASMGGCTCLLAEAAYPGLARALVLVDVVPHMDAGGTARVERFMRSSQEGFASLEHVAEAIRAYNPHRTRPPSVDGVRRTVRLGPDGRWRWHWDPALLDGTDMRDPEGVGRRLAAAARRVTVPTLLVRGAESDIVTPEAAAEFLELVPHAETVDVARAGHMVAGDDNDRFASALEDFLARLPPRG